MLEPFEAMSRAIEEIVKPLEELSKINITP